MLLTGFLLGQVTAENSQKILCATLSGINTRQMPGPVVSSSSTTLCHPVHGGMPMRVLLEVNT